MPSTCLVVTEPSDEELVRPMGALTWAPGVRRGRVSRIAGGVGHAYAMTTQHSARGAREIRVPRFEPRTSWPPGTSPGTVC